MNPDPGTCIAQAATLEVDDVASLSGTTTFEGKVDAGFELSFAANDAKLSGEADIPPSLPTAVRGAGYWFREANS
ncbi:hypothetical protein ACFCYX_16030 [Streptomyces populi]|nr:hypothetical protein [Streptomyces populi]